MKTLFDITADIAALDDLIDDLEGDVTGQEDAVAAFLAENDVALTEKVEGYARLIREHEARAAALKEEAERITALRKTSENRAKWLKARLVEAFDGLDIKKLQTATHVVSVANNGGKIPVEVNVDTADLPDAYVRTTVKTAPDLDALRDALTAGADIPGVQLGQRGRSLRIK